MYIKGTEFAKKIYEQIKNLNLKLRLGIIQIGDNAASNKYIGIKKKKLEEVGFDWIHEKLSDDIDELSFVNVIKRMSSDISINGIIVQLPIKSEFLKHLDLIPTYKDVDGVTSLNQGLLAKSIDSSCIIPCTPLAVMHFLQMNQVELSGKNVVVFGKSFLVGRPIAILLQNQGATVTVINRKTENPEAISSKADILISAMGAPSYITEQFIKKDAFVVDVGVSEVNGILCGDVDQSALQKTRFISPVTGGIGPLTVAFLLKNLVNCYLIEKSMKR